MSRFLIALLALSLAACAAAPVSHGVTQSTDEYSGFVKTEAGPFNLSPGRRLTFVNLKSPAKENAPGLRSATMSYLRSGGSDKSADAARWLFINDRQGYMKVDGVVYDLGQGGHVGEPRTDGSGYVYVTEKISYDLTPALLVKLQDALAVTGKVGQEEFVLTAAQVSELRKFAVAVQ